MRKRLGRNTLIWILIGLGVLWVAGTFVQRAAPVETVAISEFYDRVASGQVERVTVYENDQRVEAELRNGQTIRATFLAEEGGDLMTALREGKVRHQVNPQRPSLLVSVLGQFLPFILIFLLIFWLLNQSQGGGSRVMSFGRSRAKLVTKEMPKITFGDVAGLDEAVEEIREIKEYLANPSRFQAMGAKIPKGVLLFGPPGTGKTLLARAVAGEAGVPFFSISGSDFVEMFVGVGAARVRDLFEQAKAAAPAIVFVDEIDAVGRHRGAGLGGGHDEREQTLNQLLVEMDGFDARTGVVLIAATNRPDILDPALLRPGRFDRQIVVDRPDLNGRTAILKVHTRGKPLAEAIDLEVIARRTPGFTGADLANVVNEAALLTARRKQKQITMSELEESIDRVVAGPERRSRLITAEEKRIIAYHEAGHALVAYLMPHAHPVHKISIIPRGRALGYTLTLPTEDRYLVTRSELTDELAVMLGGRAAEEIVFGDVTTGAQDDINRVTKIARSMVCEYGMSALGPMALGQHQDNVFLGRDIAEHRDYSDSVAAEIDIEIRRLVEGAHEQAKDVLRDNRPVLDRLAQRLLENETVDVSELEEIFEGRPKAQGARGRMLEDAVPASEPAKRQRRAPRPKPKPGLSPA
ncbi:MAG TPA: ATP-dependent zinc metalloprotease FtsH [Actinomycetota bacterium]|nr:ATP-dependent zinc metalloprotease FtsH [Actinomycetota bacterium]